MDFLRGIRVLELSQLLAGPAAAVMLGEMGAEIIKIEPPGGESGRVLGLQGTMTIEGGDSPTFREYNRNKQLVQLDLKSAEGRRIARHLALEADVLLENFRPGVMARLGMGYEDLKAVNPGLVYCSLSAFETNGPDGERRGVDLIIQAESGLMDQTGFPDGPPTKVGFPIVDAATAYVICQAVLAALVGRSRSGSGAKLSVALHDVAVHLQASSIAQYLATGKAPQRFGNSAPLSAPADLIPTRDGYLVLSTYLSRHWEVLCEIIGMPDLVRDPRFVTSANRVETRQELIAILTEALSKKTTNEWVQLLVGHGLSAGRVRTVPDVLSDEATSPFGMVVDGTDGEHLRLPYHVGDRDQLRQVGVSDFSLGPINASTAEWSPKDRVN